MATKSLNFFDLLKLAFKKLKKQFWDFILFFALVFVLSFLADEYLLVSENFILNFIGIVTYVIQPWLTLGLMKMAIKIIKGKKIDISDFYFNFNYILKFVGLIILNALIIIGCFAMLIIPGFIAILALSLVNWVFIDRGDKLNIVETLKESNRITKGYKWQLLLLMILIGLFNLFCVLPTFGLGVLFSGPLSMIIMALVYEELSKPKKKSIVEKIIKKK